MPGSSEVCAEKLPHLACWQEATQISRRRESKPPPPFSEYAKSRVKEAIGSGSLQEVVESSLFPGDDAIYDFPSGGGGNPIDAGWDW